MKNWDIIDSFGIKGRKYLLHLHPDRTSQNATVCIYSKTGIWYCPQCGEVPPEEMQFVAELAGCVHHPTTSEYLTDATNWYLK